MCEVQCMEDKNIIMLKKRSSMTFKEQCSTYEDFIRIDVTSCNKDKKFVSEISPLFIGPVVSSDGLVANTFEDLWQYGKVYPKIYDANKRKIDFTNCKRVIGRAYNGANGKKIAVEYEAAKQRVEEKYAQEEAERLAKEAEEKAYREQLKAQKKSKK